MRENRTVLVVAKTPELANRLNLALRAQGHEIDIASTFRSARAYLSRQRPDLIIAELKLGEFNGLQLALRGQALHVPAIVIGDEAFEHEAEQLGVGWLSAGKLAGKALQLAIARVVDAWEFARGVELPWCSVVTKSASLDVGQTRTFCVTIPTSFATVH